MLKAISLILSIVLLFPYIAVSAPSISGALVSGGVLTVSGSTFGTKATAAPIRFETAEGMTAGNALSTESGWWVDRGSSFTQCLISDENQRSANSTKNIKTPISAGTPIAWKETVGFATTGKIYVDLWLRMDWGTSPGQDTAAEAYQIKLHNFSTSVDDNGGAEQAATSLYAWWFPGSPGYSHVYQTSDGGSLYWPNNVIATNYQWYHIVDIIDMGTAGNYDGSLYSYIDSIANSNNGTGKRFLATGEGDIDAIKLFNYLDANASGVTGMTIYYDDIYIDNSWARVEIGDNSVYANCTHREVQPATSWSTGEVTATFNLGSFSVEDTMYAFVIDENNVPSAGELITIDGGGSSPIVGIFKTATGGYVRR